MATQTELDLMWQMLGVAFGVPKGSDKFTAGLYAAALLDVDGQLLLAATWRTIRNPDRSKWGFPEVHELRRAAIEIVCEIRCTTPAWAERELGWPIPGVFEYVGLPAPYLTLMGERALAAPGVMR